MAIHVEEERPGVPIMSALIGTCAENFEIRQLPTGKCEYWVRLWKVTEKVFMLALELAKADVFDPEKGHMSTSLTAEQDDSGNMS